MSLTKRHFIKRLSLTLLSLNAISVTNARPNLDLQKLKALTQRSPIDLEPNFTHNVGQQYLNQYPNENDIPLLCGLLLNDADFRTGKLSSKLDSKIKSDFLKSNTLEVAGWVLSKTEARHCALIYLTQRNDLKQDHSRC